MPGHSFFSMKKFFSSCLIVSLALPALASAKLTDIDNFKARPPIHSFGGITSSPKGLSPDNIKTAYNLPKTGGSGTIAIIDAYDSPTMENDLAVFSKRLVKSAGLSF